jgi:hypothetical protein
LHAIRADQFWDQLGGERNRVAVAGRDDVALAERAA